MCKNSKVVLCFRPQPCRECHWLQKRMPSISSLTSSMGTFLHPGDTTGKRKCLLCAFLLLLTVLHCKQKQYCNDRIIVKATNSSDTLAPLCHTCNCLLLPDPTADSSHWAGEGLGVDKCKLESLDGQLL